MTQRHSASPQAFGGRCRSDSLPVRLLAAFIAGWLMLAWGVSAAVARQPLAAIVVDARSGKVLFARDADAPRYPASITKVMTLYLLFRELKRGTLTLSTRLKVSREAASRQPSKLWLKPGSTITVDQAIRALAVKSANDVAAVVAENLAGSEAAFAREMTRVARAIGMTRTTFRNASGLPRPKNITTARDLATLSLRIMRDFPEYYRRYFALKTFTWRGRKLRNHNRLLWRVRGMDGLKTGYTRAAGSNLAASVRRNGRRIVAVVLGARSSRARNVYMANLIERTFRHHHLTRGTRIAALAGTPPGWRNFGTRRLAGIPPSRLHPRVGTRIAARRQNVAKKAATTRKTATGRKVAKVAATRKPQPQATRRESLDRLILAAMSQTPPPAPVADRHAPVRPVPRPHKLQRRQHMAEVQVPKAPAPKAQTPKKPHAAATATPAARVRVKVVPPAQAEPVDFTPPSAAREQTRENPREKTREKTDVAAPAPGDEHSGVVVLAKRRPAGDAATDAVGEAVHETGAAKVAVRVRVAPPAAAAPQGSLTTVIIRKQEQPLPDAQPQAVARIARPKQAPVQRTSETAPAAAAPTQIHPAGAPAAAEASASGWRIVSADPQRAERLLRTSWNIQIGAFPTREGAERYLARARRLSGIVRRAIPVTIRVEKNGRVFYRARYAGFRRATAARVCRQLKRRGLSCLPLPPDRG